MRGAVTIGSADFSYNGYGFRAMGSFDYGHLGDADIISQHNRAQSASSPYKRTLVGLSLIHIYCYLHRRAGAAYHRLS